MCGLLRFLTKARNDNKKFKAYNNGKIKVSNDNLQNRRLTHKAGRSQYSVFYAGNRLTEKVKEVYGLGWNVYAEIYITPIKNLEWYFEAEIGDALKTTASQNSLVFNGTKVSIAR